MKTAVWRLVGTDGSFNFDTSLNALFRPERTGETVRRSESDTGEKGIHCRVMNLQN
jgi:hypothetical protein